jgi:lipoprotein-anchoring transpeptidase ErfK/SrfK
MEFLNRALCRSRSAKVLALTTIFGIFAFKAVAQTTSDKAVGVHIETIPVAVVPEVSTESAEEATPSNPTQRATPHSETKRKPSLPITVLSTHSAEPEKATPDTKIAVEKFPSAEARTTSFPVNRDFLRMTKLKRKVTTIRRMGIATSFTGRQRSCSP